MKYIAALTIAASAIVAANAFCCGSDDNCMCADGSDGTPCCATGSCNIFCCNCDGNCRGSKRGLAADLFARNPIEEAFALVDTEGNGNITLPQYLTYMQVPADSSTVDTWQTWFEKHDKNSDGIITPDEISL
ncbi:Protein Diedel [Apiospora arundinis]|uniref:Protein Diedel n=1 Tax=Apiospora arundinis TaxID=335852 RepID=A0ABR2J6X7_9PEZI